MFTTAAWIVISLLQLLLQILCNDNNNIIVTMDDQWVNHVTPTKPRPYYWNIPTFQCDYHKLNFTRLADKYGFVQNDNDRFRGNQINILYDPGNFPALLKEGATTIRRNGGVPQEGNLTSHLQLFEEMVEELIPNADFEGLAVIDFESWRPIYRQNFGTLSPYKDMSLEIERQNHPFWLPFLLEKEATRRFELHGRRFMEETLLLAKRLRPKAEWGYYAYPYCFNMSPSNMKTGCPTEVVKENDRTTWLFALSDNLHPSLYLNTQRLDSRQKIQMIEGRIGEANRLAAMVKNGTWAPRIVPYYWYKYQDSGGFLSKEDVTNSLLYLSSVQVDGLVVWGSSNDVNTRQKCLDLYKYVDTILGPAIVTYFT